MVRDTRLSDVLHVLIHMAFSDRPLTSEVLAGSMGTNPAVFRRTMAGLRDAGLVRSGRGNGGGWSLTRPLSEMTLLEVYSALGSPTLFAIGNRDRSSDCLIERNVNGALAQTMDAASVLLLDRLREITLNDLMPDADASAMRDYLAAETRRRHVRDAV